MADIIDKLIFTIADKDSATILKDDMVKAGVPKKCIKMRTDKKNNVVKLTLEKANDYLTLVINMLTNEEYGMSLEEIQTLLNIKLVLE